MEFFFFFAHACKGDAITFPHQETGCEKFIISVQRQRHRTKIPHLVKKKKKKSSSLWLVINTARTAVGP